MPGFSIDLQEFEQICRCCGAGFAAMRGTCYELGQPVGIYAIGVHSCERSAAPAAVMTVALKVNGKKIAASMIGKCSTEALEFEFIDPPISPLLSQVPFDEHLSALACRASPSRVRFLRMVDVIFASIPELEERLCTQ